MNNKNKQELLRTKNDTESDLQNSITDYHKLCIVQPVDKDYCQLKQSAKSTALLAHRGMEIALHLGDAVFLANMGKKFNYFAHQSIINHNMCDLKT